MKLSIHAGFTGVGEVQICICHADMKPCNLRPWSGCYKEKTAGTPFVSQRHNHKVDAVASRKQFTCRCAMGWLTLNDQIAQSQHAVEMGMC